MLVAPGPIDVVQTIILLRREATDIGEVIGSALTRAARVLEAHRVELAIAADLPLLDLDAVLFEQMLFNLLDNAARYTPAGSTVSLRAWREAGFLQLQVIDEGPGIPPEARARIFDKFFRAQGTDRRLAGTGLGLAVCRGFVEAMGGRITADNRQDRSGAVFTITLPITPPAV